MTQQAVSEDREAIVVEHLVAINALEADIARPEGEASAKRWQQARHVAEALAAGASTRWLASQWRKPGGGTYSQPHVFYTAKTWRIFEGDNLVITWYAAFNSDEVRGKTAAQNIVASTENEWYTPRKYIESARFVLGGIDLDPASTPEANRTIQAATYYTAKDNGLAQPWAGRVWLNPPYGRLSGAFVSRLVEEYQSGNVVAAIMLVNAHCTDTDWFQLLWDGLVCFTDHRIDFDSAGREKETTSTHGSAFGYLGPNTERFISTFNKHGPVVRRA